MQQYFTWLTVATVLLLTVEIVAGRHKGIYRKSDFAVIAGNLLLGRQVMAPLAGVLTATVFGFLLPDHRGALADMPFWLALPAVLLVSEFCFYWVHRWAHESIKSNRPVLWKIHRTHHSGKFMNVTLKYRLNLFWFLIIPTGWVSGLGLHLGLGSAVLATLLIIQAWNLITHSDFRWDDALRRHRILGRPFRAMEHVFVSPGMHHTHHGYGRDGAHYRNFAVVLSLYDWIFGTLHIPEGRPTRYGLPGKNAHWAEELFYPLVNFSKSSPVRASAPARQDV